MISSMKHISRPLAACSRMELRYFSSQFDQYGFANLQKERVAKAEPTAVNKYPTIQAIERTFDQQGSRRSRALRTDGFIPGVFYGHSMDMKPIKKLLMIKSIDVANEFNKRRETFENTIFELRVSDTESHLVTARQLQVDMRTLAPFSCNFLNFAPKNHLRIPVQFINQGNSAALRKGHLVLRINPFVHCTCDSVDSVPPAILFDSSHLAEEEVIRLKHLTFPVGVTPTVKDPELVIAIVKAPR